MVYVQTELGHILSIASFGKAVFYGADPKMPMSLDLAGCISLPLKFKSSLIHLTIAFDAITHCLKSRERLAYRPHQAVAVSLTSLGNLVGHASYL